MVTGSKVYEVEPLPPSGAAEWVAPLPETLLRCGILKLFETGMVRAAEKFNGWFD